MSQITRFDAQLAKPKDHERNYVGLVESVDDPEKLYRVQVRVYDVFDDVPVNDLPWATYLLPIGARPNDGPANPVQVGDQVWIDFPHNGDTRRPRITGSVHHMPEKKPAIPHDAWQGEGKIVHKRTEEQPVPADPGYHEDVVYRQHNVIIQITKQEVIRVTQVNTGSALEISPDGTIVLHGEKDILASAPGDCLFDIRGDYELRVGGHIKMTAGKTGILQSQQSMSVESATDSLSATAGKNIATTAATSYDLKAGTDMTLAATGSGKMTSAQSMLVASSESSLSLTAKTKGTIKGPGGLTIEGATQIQDKLDVDKGIQALGSIIDSVGNTPNHPHVDLSGQISELSGHISGIQGQVGGMLGQISGVQGQVASLQSQISGMMGQMSALAAAMAAPKE